MTDVSIDLAKPRHASIAQWSRGIGALTVIGLMLPLFTITIPNFMTVGNITNIGLQTAILLLLALPMTLVIFTEGLDLSMGAVLSLCGVVLAMQLVRGHSVLVACVCSCLVGWVFGAMNGLCVAFLRMPPFVVTLGTFGIAQGLALAITDGNAVSDLGPAIESFYAAKVLGIPKLILISIAAYGLFHVMTYHTVLGRYAIALGGNRNALVTSGVRANLYLFGIYALAGVTAGFAALCLIARTNAGHPTIAIGMEFDAIAAVVLGGTQLERGKGWLFGSVLGVLAIGILRNGLNLAGVDTALQLIAIGTLVLIVVWLGARQKGASQ